MDNGKSNVNVSERELKVLMQALAKSVQYVHTKYLVMTFIAGLLIGFGAAVLIMNVMGVNQMKPADVNVVLQKTDEQTRGIQQIGPVLKDMPTVTNAPDEKKSEESISSAKSPGSNTMITREENENTFTGSHVYIHYARERDKKIAEDLSAYLKSKGYVSIETEHIRHWKRDIRYFHDEDEDSALLLKKYLGDFLAGTVKTSKFNVPIKNLSARYPKARMGTLEVWIFF